MGKRVRRVVNLEETAIGSPLRRLKTHAGDRIGNLETPAKSDTKHRQGISERRTPPIKTKEHENATVLTVVTRHTNCRN